jgi:hypothetical protein
LYAFLMRNAARATGLVPFASSSRCSNPLSKVHMALVGTSGVSSHCSFTTDGCTVDRGGTAALGSQLTVGARNGIPCVDDRFALIPAILPRDELRLVTQKTFVLKTQTGNESWSCLGRHCEVERRAVHLISRILIGVEWSR